MLKSAKEIHQITKTVEQTKKRLEFVLNSIGMFIQEAATAGNWYISCHVGSIEEYLDINNFVPDGIIYHGASIDFGKDDFQHILKYLEEAGYKAYFKKNGESYVPAGLCDSDGYGPLYVNVHLVISWKDES